MAAAAQPKPAQLPLPGGIGGASVRVHPLLTATCAGPLAWLEAESGRSAGLHAFGIGVAREKLIRVPIVAFLVEHPQAGAIMVDTGFHPSCAIDPAQSLGRVGARAFAGVQMTPEQAATAQLRERGVDPDAVRFVVMTHLHIDHASGMSEFPGATFVFSAAEWRAATQPRGWLHGYRRQQFDHAFDYRTLDFERRGVDSYVSFGRAFDLFGDGSVRLVYTPGHTLGHLSVILRLREREMLLAGDAIYTRRTLEGGARPYRTEDEHLFGRSLREIQIYAESQADVLVIPGHDMEDWKTLETVYE